MVERQRRKILKKENKQQENGKIKNSGTKIAIPVPVRNFQ